MPQGPAAAKRSFRTALLAFALAGGVLACGNPCRELADQVCNCLPDDGSRSTCQSQARQAESIQGVSSADAQFCQQRLDSKACQCSSILTAAGRQACGLSYPR